MIRDGYIKVARRLMNNKVWLDKPSWWLKVWVYILMRVNHTDNQSFKRGTNFFTYQEIYTSCRLANEGITSKSIQNAINWFRRQDMVRTHKSTRGIVITVCNYSIYQEPQTYSIGNTQDKEQEIRRTRTGHTQDTISKELRNEENKLLTDEKIKKGVKTPFKEMMSMFIGYWNKYKDGRYMVTYGKDGKVAKELWKECMVARPDNPMSYYEDKLRLLFEKFDIQTFGGVRWYWNRVVPKKEQSDFIRYGTPEWEAWKKSKEKK